MLNKQINTHPIRATINSCSKREWVLCSLFSPAPPPAFAMIPARLGLMPGVLFTLLLASPVLGHGDHSHLAEGVYVSEDPIVRVLRRLQTSRTC